MSASVCIIEVLQLRRISYVLAVAIAEYMETVTLGRKSNCMVLSSVHKQGSNDRKNVIDRAHVHGMLTQSVVNYRACARSHLPVLVLLIVRAHGQRELSPVRAVRMHGADDHEKY